MKNLLLTLTVVMALCLTANVAMADPNDAATAAVTCTVDTIVEWDDTVNAGDFDTIAIPNITDQNTPRSAHQHLVLYTNDDVVITADNTDVAQLMIDRGGAAEDKLVTKYMLAYDGDGDPYTGGTSEVAFTDYTIFIAGGSAVTHALGDGAVEVTLSAQASNDTGNVADAGAYTATQTLTATW